MAAPRPPRRPAGPYPAPPDPAAGPPDPADPLDAFRPLPPQGLLERMHDLVDRYGVRPGRAAPAVGGLVVAAAVGWWLLRPPAPPVEATLPVAGATAAAPTGGSGGSGGAGSTLPGAGGTSTTTAPEVVVQASGAVARPGVYRLPPGSRVDDLVRAAGGLTAEADPDRVNLATPLTDGQRLWLPRRGDWAAPEVVAGDGGPAPGGAGPSPGGGADGGPTAAPAGPPAVVDLNTATAADLDTLPGVGPATATAILAYRDEHGPFASVDDLLEVRGIGDAKLEQLRPLVTV